ncbi:hypothetical protein ACLK1G_04910 [Pseudomonas sp. NR3]|uniref:hypothetical protein n=1 Tax=Pseudomonas sp. NR3 TaxID=3155978 RepID=UPI003B683814
MQKIGSSTSTANGAGEYTEGSPGSGVDATLITAAWLNTIQRELVNLILGASLTLNPADDSQVLKAVQALQTSMSTWAKITGKPTTVAGYGITDTFTKTETSSAIQAAVAALVASSPAALDTLKELAAALGNDPNFATTMTNALASKANKATTLAGYGISDAYTQTQIDDLLGGLTDPWAFMPIGMPFPFWDNNSVPAPSRTNPNYRYIRLTAADSYNAGALVSESVSGTSPLVVATGVVNFAGSLFNGLTINLINTERRVIRAGLPGVTETDQIQGHWHDYWYASGGRDGSTFSDGFNAAATTKDSRGPTYARVRDAISDGVNGTPRIGLETRAKNIGATYYMRIK